MNENRQTVLYQVKEVSRYMMGFVIITKQNNAVVIDGGHPEDFELMLRYIGTRHISAWILTHPHDDHIEGFTEEILKRGLSRLDLEAVYYAFPPYAEWENRTDVPDPEYFKREFLEMMPRFKQAEPIIKHISHKPEIGDKIRIDELEMEFLYTFRDGLYSNPMNDASLVFKITGEKRSVLFLGDLGPEGGKMLLLHQGERLKADAVQMAHHGHMDVGEAIYRKVMPEICLWCAPEWLYNEPAIPDYLSDRAALDAVGRGEMFGTRRTRDIMDTLGVRQHLVTGYGTNELII